MSNTSTGKARYCKTIRRVKVRENDEVYSIEKIFLNHKYEE